MYVAGRVKALVVQVDEICKSVPSDTHHLRSAWTQLGVFHLTASLIVHA